MNSSSLGSIAHRAAKIVATVISVLAFSVSVLVPAITHAQVVTPATLYVNAATGSDTNTGTTASSPFQTIQAAVNAAASGDTISVAAGTYDAFKVVGASDLTITGAGAGQTIIEPTTLIQTGVGHKYTSDMLASVFVNTSTNITIQDMTIEGNGQAPGEGGPDALVFWNASTGTVSDSAITGNYTINGLQTGQGIAVDAGTVGGVEQTTNLTVNNDAISGFQKNAIDAVDGNSTTSSPGSITLTVTGGSITGAGSTGVIAQNGILAWNQGGGTVTGTVNGTTISNLVYAPTQDDVAVYTYGSATIPTVSNVTFSNDDYYIYNDSTASTPIDASTGNTYDGVSTADATPAQLASIQNDLGGTITYTTPAPTGLTAQFQYDSSTLASGSYLNEIAKSGNNDLELQWTAPAGTITGYHILDTYPDGTTSTGYQGPNTNAWLAPNGFGAHGDGAYTYQVVAITASGSSVPSATFTLNYDTTAPVITSITPAAGSVVGGTKTFTVDATDANPSYIYEELNQNGNWITDNTQSGTEGATESTLTYDTTKLTDGTYTIKVDAVDKAGNTTEQDYTFTVDNTPPTITSMTPADGSTISGTVTFTADDSDTNASYMYVELNQNGDWITDDTKSGTSPSATEASVIYDTTKLTNGTYTIKVDAVDKAGNTTEKDYTYTVDNVPVVVPPPADTTPPSVPVQTYPATGATLNTNSFTYTWDASTDASSSPVTYQVQVSTDGVEAGGVLSDVIYTSPVLTTNSLVSNGAPDGTYYWQVRATDAAGNVSDWSPVESVTLDTAATTTPVAPATPTTTTLAATNVTETDATLNGTSPAVSADGSSFWVSTSPFTTASGAAPTLPSGVYSTLNLGSQATSTSFSAALSSLATAAYPSAMPAVTPNTTYYFTAWTLVNGIWYPGTQQSLTTSASAATTTSATPAPTTGAATAVTETDATLTAVNGAEDVDAESFWISTSTPIDTSNPNSIPDGVYSTAALPAVSAGDAFQAQLSEATTQGYPSNLPAITPNTTYYYVAWVHVNGSWYPGSVQSVTTASVPALVLTAQPDNVRINENASTTIPFSVSNAGVSGSITYTITTPPTNGTLSTVSNNSVVYTPNTGYYGADSFAYAADGGTPATVSITVDQVLPTYSTPVATDVTATSTLDAPITITLAATNSDGNPVTYATSSSPTDGTLSAISGDTVTYTPDPAYSGTDSFTYNASNEGNATSTDATVTITVTAPVFTGPVFSSNVATGQGTSGGSVAHSFAASSGASSGGTGSTGGSVDGGQVLGASTYNFTKNLGVGSVGEDVTQLQLVLISDGYMSTSTGYFGFITKDAVKKYQAAHDISPVSGYVGPLTRAVLNEGTTPTVAQEAASMGASTTASSTATTTVTATTTPITTGTSTPASSTATSSPVSIAATSLVNKLAAEIAALEAQLSATTTASTTTATSTPSN